MIRRARPADVAAIHTMIGELAEYERARHEVRAAEEDLHRVLFGANPTVYAHVAEAGGRIVGFALWFLNYSTWLGRNGIYLEDLYVRPAERGAGHGTALLTELARVATEHGYGRLEWAVLNWNEPAITFYRSLGAGTQDDWLINRVTGPALDRLAARAEPVESPQGE